VLLVAAIDGSRVRTEHPEIPITPLGIARASVASIRAGAGAVHFHIRGPDGLETSIPTFWRGTSESIRAEVGNVPIGVSTGAWIEADSADRLDKVRAWHAKPDFTSANFDEEVRSC
jgi:uncharacterized protein (DUF849 family)